MPYNHWSPDTPYMDIVPLLEEHTEPGSLIGLTGGGNVGYFIHDRTDCQHGWIDQQLCLFSGFADQAGR